MNFFRRAKGGAWAENASKKAPFVLWCLKALSFRHQNKKVLVWPCQVQITPAAGANWGANRGANCTLICTRRADGKEFWGGWMWGFWGGWPVGFEGVGGSKSRGSKALGTSQKKTSQKIAPGRFFDSGKFLFSNDALGMNETLFCESIREKMNSSEDWTRITRIWMRIGEGTRFAQIWPSASKIGFALWIDSRESMRNVGVRIACPLSSRHKCEQRSSIASRKLQTISKKLRPINTHRLKCFWNY